MPNTTKVASLNPAHDEVYSIKHYVIKFVSDFWQVGGFLQVFRISSTDITEILLKVVVNTTILT